MPTYKLNQLLNNVKFALYFKISLEEGVEEWEGKGDGH